MSIKVKQAFKKTLEKISARTFDEDDIRTLLILVREYLGVSLTRELAHFIAHPERNMGLFHKKVNARYAKWKLVQLQALKIVENTELMSAIQSEDALSDFLLEGTNCHNIDAKLYEILYMDGLDDTPEEHLKKYTGFSKVQAAEYLNKFYVKQTGIYIINNEAIRKELKANFLKSFNKSLLNKDIYELIDRHFADDRSLKHGIDQVILKIERLQKVIRGQIYFSSVYQPNELKDEIMNSLSIVINSFDLSEKYITYISSSLDEIQLCILTLLHDAKFIFYDNNFAKTYLVFYLHTRIPTLEDIENEKNVMYVYQNGMLALQLCFELNNKTLSYPLAVSDLKIRDYISFDDFQLYYVDSSMLSRPIPWHTAARLGECLRLVKGEV